MQWSDMDIIRDIISTLAVQGWKKILEEDSSIDFIDRLVHKFSTPLHGAQIDVTKIKEEFEFLLQYAVQYISLATLDYRAAWWRIFHAPTAAEWTNALTLIQLLFSLPASNGKLERAFSEVNVIKTSKRNLLTNESLDDLLLLSIEGPPLQDFSPDPAIDLWWKEKTTCRRPHQNPRKQYKKRQLQQSQSSSTSTADGSQSSSDDSDTDLLAEWDDWIEEEEED